MKQSEFKKKICEIDTKLDLEAYEKRRRTQIEMDEESQQSNRNRARSITVGTAFGGTTEVIMRSDAGRHLWCVMQPVEVMELIHQLSANIGCHIHIKPRQDFGSWRDWKLTEEEKLHYNGHPPFVSDMAEVQQLGANMEAYENKIKSLEKEGRAGNSVNVDEAEKITNKFIEKNGGRYMLGGHGADSVKLAEAEMLKQTLEKMKVEQNGKDTVATEKTVNKRTAKRATRAA